MVDQKFMSMKEEAKISDVTDVNSTTTGTSPAPFDLVSIAVGQVHVAQSVYGSMQKGNI